MLLQELPKCIILTKSRGKELEKGLRFATIGGLDEEDYGSTTGTGNLVIELIPREVQKAMRRTRLPARFDALLGLTFGLLSQNYWMNDHEGWIEAQMQEALRVLAGAWHTLLQKSDEELEIDPEFTRPGILQFLTRFQERVESVEREPEDAPFSFPWQVASERRPRWVYA